MQQQWYIGQYIGHIAAGCSYQHTSLAKFPTVWDSAKNKMAEIQDGSYTYGGIQTYRKVSKHGAFKHTGGACASKHTGGASKHTGGIQTLQQAEVLQAVLYIWGQPNIQGSILTFNRTSNIWVVSKHMGVTPLYVWMPPMFGCYLYIWTSPCMFGCPHMFGHPCMFG